MTADSPISLRGSVASGVRWSSMNQVVQQAVRFTVQVVLTRILAPESFGLLALAFVVVNFGSLLTGLGFSQALIQRRDLSRGLVDAVFMGSALLGLGLAAAVAASAVPLAALLGDTELVPILRVLAAVFVFQGLEGVPNCMLRRQLMFRQFVLSSTIAAVVGGALGVGLGLAGLGVWALVWFAVSEAIIAGGLAWVFALSAGVWRPRMTLHLRPLGEVLAYSTAVTGNRILNYGSRNLDNLIVGRVLGTLALGYYGLAYRVMLFPIQRVADVITSVTLPAFAQLQHDADRLANAFLRAMRYLLAVTVPATIGVAVVAHHLVPVVFGPRWAPAIQPLMVLALSGPALALVRLVGNVWEATGRAGLNLVMSAIGIALLVPGFLIGVRFGVMGVATAYTATAYAGLLPTMVALARTTGVSLRLQLASVRAIAGATVGLVAAALVVDRALLPGVGHVTGLLATTVAGGLAYVGSLMLLDRGFVSSVLGDLRPRKEAAP